MTIKKMPGDVIEKFAAGEVVQRPASAVKELIENSIDAGADHIDTTFSGGGINYIEVSDNGSGIPGKEIPLALERHATSKISTAEDLSHIKTMGFRGEALPSIAAVSKLSVITSCGDSNEAGLYKLSGGSGAVSEPAARGKGTTVKAEELFYNVPARKKFLKSLNTEKRYIIKTVRSLALSRPDITFNLNEEKDNIFKYTGSNLKERFVAVNGKKLWDKLLELDFENPFLKIKGYITKPEITYSNKNKISFTVNDRPVDSPLVFHALMQGYRSYIPPSKYPAAIIKLEIDSAAVDVNVHPAKKEVRFVNQQGIHSIVASVIGNILQKTSSILEIDSGAKKQTTEKEKKYGSLFKQSSRKGNTRPGLPSFKDIDPLKLTKYTFSSFGDREKSGGKETPAKPDGKIIPRFQLFKKYVIAEDDKGLLLIDQHTAWERINYEKFQKQYKDNAVNSQRDMFPQVIELEPAESELLKEKSSFLESFGIELENFGPGTFKITSTPVIAGKDRGAKEAGRMIEEILDIVGEYSDTPDSKELIKKTIETVACRKSVKAGETLDEKEIKFMIAELSRCRTPHRCPHGRPVIIRLSEDELDKKFDRK